MRTCETGDSAQNVEAFVHFVGNKISKEYLIAFVSSELSIVSNKLTRF